MPRLGVISFIATILIYMVIALGGYVRSIGAGMACGADWPTCRGYLIPPDLLDPFVFSEYIHRVLAILSLLFVMAAFAVAWTRYRSTRPVILWVSVTAILLAAEVMVGMIVVVFELLFPLSALHLAFATATFGASAVLTVVSMRADKLLGG